MGSTEAFAPIGPSGELGHGLTAALEQAELREVLRKTAQIVGLSGSVALPRQIAGQTGVAAPLLGLQVLVDLVGDLAGGSQRFGITLPVEQAAGLVDRLLGGTGAPGMAAQAGALSEAECGVLAYLAARCCAALGGVRVADVQCVPGEQLAARLPGAICWPLQLRAPQLTLDACLLFAGRCPDMAVELQLLAFDELEAGALTELEPGDLLVSDRLPLIATSRGLEGTLALRVAGSPELLQAELIGDRLRVTGSARSAPVALQLGRFRLPFAQLAALVSGAPQQLPVDALAESWLLADGQPRVRGRLVQHAAQVALEVLALHSTR